MRMSVFAVSEGDPRDEKFLKNVVNWAGGPTKTEIIVVK